MAPVRLFVPFLIILVLGVEAQPLTSQQWQSRAGRGDGTLEPLTFRVERPSPGVVETSLPGRGPAESKVRVEVDRQGRLVRSRTDYLVASLSSWYRADFLLTEVQPGAAEGGKDNFAFQRVWKNEVQEAKNLAWGPEFVEFSTLPFLLQIKLAGPAFETWGFQTYAQDIPGDMVVRILHTDRPLGVETRYAYPRWLRERFGSRPVVLAELTATGNLKGAYPYPFYYAYTTGPDPEWIAAWGGNPRQASFQWRED